MSVKLLKSFQLFIVIVNFILIFGLCEAIPKLETQPSQKQVVAPSSTSNIYTDNNQWQRSYHNNNKLNETTPESSNNKERLQRLGYTTGYGGINGYPHSGTGISGYSPVKLDLGGVVLGTLVGIGAILIIPKIISIFHGGYSGGQYARSDSDNDMSSIVNILTKLDDVLGQNNIDSTNCIQRAICTYVRSTESNIQTGSADQIDQFIHTLSENSLVDYMLDGTAIKEALNNGKNIQEKDCIKLYPSCPLDTNTAVKILTKTISKNSQ